MRKETIEILKNFSSVNQGMMFRKGVHLRTMAVMKNVFAVAQIPDEIPRDFAIYDLNEYLATLSFLESPEIKYNEDHVEIRSGSARVKYVYSSPTVIVAPPADKNITIVGALNFQLPATTLEQIQKASSVMKLKELEISNDGIRVFNKTKTSSGGNQYDVKVDNLEGSLDDTKILKIENLKLLPRDYNVAVGERGVQFTSIAGDLSYVISVEAAQD